MHQGRERHTCEEEDRKDAMIIMECFQNVERPLENEEQATDTDWMNESSNVECEFEANSQGKQL